VYSDLNKISLQT